MAHKSSSTKLVPIISVDNYSHKNYLYKRDSLTPLSKLSYKSNHFYTTYLANKDMIIAPIEVSAGMDDDDMDGLIDDRAYEELGLDPTREYIIRRLEIESKDPGKRIFQIFVVEQNTYRDVFAPLRDKVKYIDQVIPAPLLYYSLYNIKAIAPKGVHAFLYFTHYDTFVTFYHNGKYLYSKSVPFSLKQIYNRYCEVIGDTVDEEQFYKTLQKDGLKAAQSDFQQNLMKIFGEIFISINDIIIYTKRAYDLEVVDQMFIGSELGPIVGLDEYVQNYLGFHSSTLEFDFDMQTEEWHTDQMQYMMAASALDYQKNGPEGLNFTLYPKPPPFFKRPAGQMMVASILMLMVALAWPAYLYISAKLNDIQTSKLQKEDRKLAQEVSKYKKILKTKKTEYDKAQEIVKALMATYSVKEKTLRSVHEKKVHYRMKSDQIASFSKDLSHFGVLTNSIVSDKNNFLITLISSEDKNITKTVKEVASKYAKEIKLIDIQRIQKDENSTFYQGVLRVDLK